MEISEIRRAIIQRRKERGLTQEQLGKLARVSRELISRFENHAHDIGLRRLLRLSEALDLEMVLRAGRGRPTIEELDDLFRDDD